MTPAQCRAARGLLDWTQRDLAAASRASEPAIRQFEKGQRATNGSTIVAMEHAFGKAGVSFIDEGVDLGAGVCFTIGIRP